MGLFKPNIEKMEKKRDVNGLIEALKHKDPQIVGAAAKALVRIGEPAVEPLIQILKDEEPRVRIIAVAVLGDIGHTQAIEPLADVLRRDTFFRVAEEAASALAKIGKPAFDVLVQALGDKGFVVRLLTVDALGRMGDERAVDYLILALKDENLEVRKKAAIALGNLGDPRAIEPLSKTLEDARSLKSETEAIRLAVTDALIKIGVKVGKPAIPLIQVFKYGPGEAFRYGFTDLRKKVEAALDQIGWEPQDTTARAYYLIMKKRWEVLAKLGEPVVEPLIQALRYSDLRREATRILGEIGDARAVEPILQVTPYEDGTFTWIVNEALVKIGEPAVEPLIQALERKGLQHVAVGILGKIGDARAVEPLIQVLNNKHEHENVGLAVAVALGEIGDPRASEAIVNWLFMPEQAGLFKSRFVGLIEAMKNLFGDYTDLILKASAGYTKSQPRVTRTMDGANTEGVYDYDLQESDEAIRELCKISTQISNNILHKISQKKDIKVVVSWACAFYDYGSLSFESQRQIAIKELERRGNPPYDPSAYLNKEAWKL